MTSNSCKSFQAVQLGEMHLNASKPALVDMTMEREIVTSSLGSVAPLVQLLPGNNLVVEMIVTTTTMVTVVLHRHGLLVVEATIKEATGKVDTAVLLAAGLHHGNASKTLHPHRLRQAADTEAMVDIQEATEMLAEATAHLKAWVPLQVWVAVLAVWVLLQVSALFSKLMAPMAPQVVLHLHLLLMTFRHQ